MPLTPPIETEHFPTTWSVLNSQAGSWSKWPKSITPGVVQKSNRSFIVIPAFNIANPIGGVGFVYSYCIAQFNYSVGQSFAFNPDAFIQYTSDPAQYGKNAYNCQFVVRWYNTDTGEVFRYKLIDGVVGTHNTKDFNYIPLYVGQVIGVNFSIEIWSYPFDTSSVSNQANIQAFTSLYFPLNYTATNIGDINLGNVISSTNINDFPANNFECSGFPIPIPLGSKYAFVGN